MAQSSLYLKKFPFSKKTGITHTASCVTQLVIKCKSSAGFISIQQTPFSTIPPTPAPTTASSFLSLQQSAVRAHYHGESSWKTSLINRTKQAYMLGKLWTSLSLAKAFQIHPLLFLPPPAGEGCGGVVSPLGLGVGTGRIAPKQGERRSPRLGAPVPRAKD